MEYHFLIEKTLENRGITREFLDGMEQSRSEPMLNVEPMCKRLKAIHDSGDCITFIPDFDMDGIMSGVTGFAGLCELGFNTRLFLPDPTEGYGFGKATIKRLVREYPDTKAIMTGDVGISCNEGLKFARSLGIQTLVTDHHMEPAEACEADVCVDPMQKHDPYDFPHICGAAVVYKVLQAYADAYCDKFVSEQIRRLRVFAGIGTVADGMPVLKENRRYIRDAVSILSMVYAAGSDKVVGMIHGCPQYVRAFYGLYTVMDVLAGHGKLRAGDVIDETFLGFYVAPVFNSVKRMGEDMDLAFGTFFGGNPREYMEKLFVLNEQRKETVEKHFKALKTSEKRGMEPYIYIIDAPSGVLGLLAQNVMSETGMPCMVLRPEDNGNGKTVYFGSGRSPWWYDAVTRTAGHGVALQGHETAFGVKRCGMDELKEFYAFMKADAAESMRKVDPADLVWKPDFVIDQQGRGDTAIDILSFLEYLDGFKRLAPFGNGFKGPDILLRIHRGEGIWSRIGREKQHVKVTMPRGLDVLAWNCADQMDRYESRDTALVRGRLETSSFNGEDCVQFVGKFIESEAVLP